MFINSNFFLGMDKKKCADVLKAAKDRVERENDAFKSSVLCAFDKRIGAELQFKTALDCLLNSTRSANELLNIEEILNSDKDDAQIIASSKKSRKHIAGMS